MAPARRMNSERTTGERWLAGIVFCLSISFGALTEARVVAIEVSDRAIVLEGREFGDAGAYEKIVGTIRFSVDPSQTANRRIVDLAMAPRDESGGVTAVSDFMVLKPLRERKGGDIGLLEVSNRGGKALLPYFAAAARGINDPDNEAYFGDGLPLRLGLTLIWVGWQFDVPVSKDNLNISIPVITDNGRPVVGLARSDWVVDETVPSLAVGHRDHDPYPVFDPHDERNILFVRDGRDARRRMIESTQWRFGRVVDDRPPNDDLRWITLDGGFQSGHIYELVYAATDPRPVGMGLAAVRDTMSYALYDDDALFGVRYGLAFGVSQTGRFLRHFLYQGFNRDERGRRVFDGMLIHTAGAGRGSFNHRFAQPSRDAHRYSAFFYPTDLFPFSSLPEIDPLTRRNEGLLDALPPAYRPRVITTNTGYEYWGRAASLIHTGPEGKRDLALAESERIYHLSSGQHFVERWPPSPERQKTGARGWVGNPVDFLVNLRALLTRLVDWVAEGRPPPPSKYPRLDSDEIVVPADLEFPSIPGVAPPLRAHEAYRADYGPLWQQGIITQQPPVLGPPFVTLVPVVDRFGNEVAGIRNVETRVPLATYTPWALRDGLANPHELVDFRGMMLPLPVTARSAVTRGDPRPAIETLYPSRNDYLEEVAAAAGQLVAEGFLLEEDRPRVTARAEATWDRIMATEKKEPGKLRKPDSLVKSRVARR